MSAELSSSIDAFVAAVHDFEARLFTSEQCVTIVEQLARLENASAAARARAAARVAESGAHRSRGFRDPADWMAQTTGSTSAECARAIETARQLDELPETSEKVAAGELSMAQAHEVALTVKAGAASEHEMVQEAKSKNLRDLRDCGRKKRLAAIDPVDLERRQHAARFHRQWRDENGMVRYTGAMVPTVGVPFMNRVNVETDRALRRAHREGRAESREQYAADAFATVVSGNGKPHPTRADVVFVADVNTGEAHIVGGGPVPMERVREAAADGFVKAVLHDGVKVDRVVHYGRKAMPAVLRTVLELGRVPEFDGVKCIDCGRQLAIEWDHPDPVANGGPTCVDNQAPRCRWCHAEKTERDRLAGLLARAP